MLRKMFRFLFGLVITVSVIACQHKVNPSSPKPLPQDEAIQVYFNHDHSRGENYIEPYRKIKRDGDNLEQVYLDGIESANISIDFAIQALDLPNLAKALVKKHQEGVKVRIIIENTYHKTWGNEPKFNLSQLSQREQEAYQNYVAFVDVNEDGKISQAELKDRDTLIILKNGNVPLIDDTEDNSKGSGLMHHKFMIIDNKLIITGSANLTQSGIHGDFTRLETRGNANNVLKIKSPELAQLFTEEFNYMWGDGVGGNKDSRFGINKPERLAKTVLVNKIPVTVKFSPNSRKTPWEITSNGLINQQLSKANKLIDLALFVFSEQKLVNTLKSEAENNVKIRGLIDPQFAFRSYSEGLDMLGVALADNCRYELNNQPWKIPLKTIGIPNLPQGDKLHHKFGIIDQNIVITGSHNWSSAANLNNDETLLIIESPLIAKHYLREFEQFYQTATLGIPRYVNQRIVQQKQQCSTITSPTSVETDGVVNVNTASIQALMSLPGIGEKTAQKIIIERQKQPFTSLEDLQRVSGIGKKKSENLRGKVSF